MRVSLWPVRVDGGEGKGLCDASAVEPMVCVVPGSGKGGEVSDLKFDKGVCEEQTTQLAR